jgi:hypothetical protein
MYLLHCYIRRETGFVEDLELHGLLGRGGFGSVFSGNWKGSAAAIKVGDDARAVTNACSSDGRACPADPCSANACCSRHCVGVFSGNWKGSAAAIKVGDDVRGKPCKTARGKPCNKKQQGCYRAQPSPCCRNACCLCACVSILGGNWKGSAAAIKVGAVTNAFQRIRQMEGQRRCNQGR